MKVVTFNEHAYWVDVGMKLGKCTLTPNEQCLLEIIRKQVSPGRKGEDSDENSETK